MPPSGVALRDPRQQLFDAAERALLRDGPCALRSRDVTEEAGCAKGLLHRYFASFDAFLAELVLDRTSLVETEAVLLAGSAGLGRDPVDVVTDAVCTMLDPTRVRLVRLVTVRDPVRELLRERWLTGIPVLTDVALALGGYLRAERDLGRLAGGVPPDVLGRALAGLAYQAFADDDGGDHREKLRADAAALLGVQPAPT